MERLDNAYRTLGIHPGASVEEIRKEWKALSIQNHPDKVGPEGNAKIALINDAYDILINELQAREILSQQQKQNHQRRSSNLSPFDTGGQQKKPKSKPQSTTSPPPKSSKPWPTRKCPREPPPLASLPNPPPNSTDASLASLLRKHNTYIAQLLDVQALADSVHDWVGQQSFTGVHPTTYAASGHVRSRFKSEIKMHNKVFYFLEGLDWRSASRKDSEKQVYWYIRHLVDGTKDKLAEMHTWLENFMMDFIVIGQKFDEAAEWRFFENARKWCAEDQGVYLHRRSR